MCSGTAILPVSCSSAAASIALSASASVTPSSRASAERALLHAPDVAVRHFVLGVDRRRQRLDRREQQAVELPTTCCFESSSRPNDDRSVRYEISSSGRISAIAPKWTTRGAPATSSSATDAAGEVARKQRQEVLAPDRRDRRRAEKRDRRGGQAAVDAEVGRGHRARGGTITCGRDRVADVERPRAGQAKKTMPDVQIDSSRLAKLKTPAPMLSRCTDRNEDAVERQRDRAGLGTEQQHAREAKSSEIDSRDSIDGTFSVKNPLAIVRAPKTIHSRGTPVSTSAYPQRAAMATPARTTETTQRRACGGRHAQCPSPVHALPQTT